MHLVKRVRPAIFCVALIFSGSVFSQPTRTTHCLTDERVQFSCRIGTKLVSLCAGGEIGMTTSLSYRYGRIGKIENEFIARHDNNNRFYATAMPANPRAAVKQVWFNRGEIRYLLTECNGGSCPQQGGLAVLRGYRVLMNARCKDEKENDLAWFSSELVSFNLGEKWNVQSATPLLEIVKEDYHFDELFPSPPGVLW